MLQLEWISRSFVDESILFVPPLCWNWLQHRIVRLLSAVTVIFHTSVMSRSDSPDTFMKSVVSLFVLQVHYNSGRRHRFAQVLAMHMSKNCLILLTRHSSKIWHFRSILVNYTERRNVHSTDQRVCPSYYFFPFLMIDNETSHEVLFDEILAFSAEISDRDVIQLVGTSHNMSQTVHDESHHLFLSLSVLPPATSTRTISSYLPYCATCPAPATVTVPWVAGTSAHHSICRRFLLTVSAPPWGLCPLVPWISWPWWRSLWRSCQSVLLLILTSFSPQWPPFKNMFLLRSGILSWFLDPQYPNRLVSAKCFDYTGDAHKDIPQIIEPEWAKMIRVIDRHTISERDLCQKGWSWKWQSKLQMDSSSSPWLLRWCTIYTNVNTILTSRRRSDKVNLISTTTGGRRNIKSKF